MERIELFAENEDGSDEYHHGACGIDGPHKSERQVFHAKICAKPAGKHNAGFQYNPFLYFPSPGRNEKQGPFV